MKMRKRIYAAMLAVIMTVSSVIIPEAGYAYEVNAAEHTELVNVSTEWKYLDDGTDPAEGFTERTAWTLDNYETTDGWKSSSGKFGAKEGMLQELEGGYTPTVLLNQYKENEHTDIESYFFRTTFEMSEIPNNMELQGTIVYDDAAVIYLNGTKIASFDAEDITDNLQYSGMDEEKPKKGTIEWEELSCLKEGTNILAVEIHQGCENSTDVYFEMSELKLTEKTEQTDTAQEGDATETEQPVQTQEDNETESEQSAPEQKAISLTVGADETSRNITWYSTDNAAGQVQYAVKNGDTFPETYAIAEASVKETSDEGFYSNQAMLENLQANTEYAYRLVNGMTTSETYHFRTGDNDKNFSFLFVGDPQIGEKNTTADAAQWENTLTQAAVQAPDAEFIVSAGDQVSVGNNETQYAGYLEHAALKSMPVATVIGNHDHGYYVSGGAYKDYEYSIYNDHFNNPNKYGTEEGKTTANSDYWYTYNNVLFLNLNSNDLSTASHQAFLKEALEANKDKDIDWKVVVFHHSIFSAATHSQDSDILQRREQLAQVFQNLDIDVVLMGHDHVYVRSYMMDGTSPEVTETVQSVARDPEGILYVTANSSSGSKFYSILGNASTNYAAVKNQENKPNFSNIEITENSFKITTYRSEDLSVVDSFKIQRTSDKPEIEGDGSGENPYLLDSDADLREMAEKINANEEEWVGKNYALDADIQMKSDSFPVINSFTGVLDGKGYTISGLTINEPEKKLDGKTEHRAAFIGTNTGTIQNLNFENADIVSFVDSGTNSYSGAAVVVGENADGGVISRVQVKNSRVTAQGMGKAAGIAALNGRNTKAGAAISDCRFDGSLSCGGNTAYGAMMGGITAYTAGPQSLVENCYANAEITYTGTENETTVSAAMICGYPNAVSIRANVAGGGNFTIPENVITANIGRIYGLYNVKYQVQTKNNLANEEISMNGNLIVPEDNEKDDAVQGKSKTADALTEKETYTAIGWDFKSCWKMGEDKRPELKEPGSLALEGSGVESDPFQIGSEDDLLYAAALLNKNDGRVTGKYFSLTEDIVLTENFPMIASFSGVFDGAGHSISGLKIIDTDTSTKKDYLLGFVRVNSGTIKDLAFESPIVETSVTCNTDSFSGVAVIAGENANGGLIHGCRVSNAAVKAPNAAKAAGITALNGRNNKNSAKITNCYVSGDFSCGGTAVSYGTMMGGIASYSCTSSIENCITDVTLHCDASNVATAVVSQSSIVGYINAVTLKGNVAYGRTMTADGQRKTYNAGGIYGTIAATSGKNTISGNLSCEEIKINNKTIASSEKNGKLMEKESLQMKQTYEDLGWRFELEWKMTEENYPIPRVFSYPDSEITRVTASIKEDGVGFSWYSQKEEAAYVVISTDMDMKNAQKTAASVQNAKSGFHCTADVNGLKADTTYYYQVQSGENVSETGTFRTAPETGAFTFLNLAGTDSGSLNETSVAADTMRVALNTCKNAAFLLHSGSMIDAERGEEAWKELFFQAQNTFLSVPVIPTVGSEGADVMLDQFHVGEKGYYSFDYSNAHIAVLDTNEDTEQCVSDAQLEWLKEDVVKARKNGAEWIILSVNKGPYTTGNSADNKEVAGLRSVLLPVIDELEIDLVLQGQDHILGRTYSVKDGNADKAEYMEMVNGKRFYYSLSEEGTIYFMPGQAGTRMESQISKMTTEDLDEYIALFSRSEQRGSTSNPTQTFASVKVDGDKLTVCTYERKNTDTATMIEAFGIDRAVGKVEKLIQEKKWEEARTAYNLLTDAQKAEVENYYLLLQAENTELEKDKGAWLDKEAKERRSILLRNDTFSVFEDAPIRLEIEKAPSKTMKFYTTRGEELPYEIESYDKNGTSIVWVKVPAIEANAVTGIWVYFGGNSSQLDAKDVWNNHYALVEHFTELNDTMKDSTGKATGKVTGTLKANDKGADKGAHFADSKITYDSIGDDYDAISISAIVSMTEKDMKALNGGKGVITAKFLSTENDTNAYQMSIDSSTQKLSTSYYAKWWREHNYNTSAWPTDQKTDYTYDVNVTDGNQHLLTMMYDGLTVTTYIDGVAVQKGRVFLENSIYVDESLPTVIGAYSDEALTGAFAGTIYDVQISGAGTSEQWEAFRYSAYFGDAVTVGKAEKNGDLVVNADVVGRSETLEAGKQQVQGILSKDADVTITVGEKTFYVGKKEAGMFTENITMTGIGEQEVTVSAAADGKTDNCKIKVKLEDTAVPEVGGTASEVSDSGQNLVVNLKESADETLTTDFYLGEGINLSKENMEIAEGSISENTPEKIDPTACDYTAQELANATTKTEDGSNPYQIYKMSLTEEQVTAGTYHIGWHGTSSRQIHAYAYDQDAKTWVKAASTTGTGNVSMDIQIEGSQYTKDGKLYLLFFRGLGQEPEDMEGYTPEKGQYDFSMSWTSDVQYTSEFYEDILLQQKKWIADTQDEYNSVMNIDTGDVANAAYLSWEYNWKTVDKAYNILENAKVPYTIAWGNHDYKYVDKYNLIANSDRLYRQYFPLSRFEENLGGWKMVANNKVTDDMCLTQTIHGSKIMLLTLSFWMDDTDIAWAKEIVTNPEYADYNIIILTHHFNNSGKITSTKGKKLLRDVIQGNENVKLLLCGHVDGVDIINPTTGGRQFYSILQDYQDENGTMIYGGNGFLRMMNFDVENNLIYFNTYSPLTGEYATPWADGAYTKLEGLYQKNRDEFAVEVDLGGNQERTFTTSELSISTTATKKIGTVVSKGNETITYQVKDLKAGQGYTWYAITTDSAGNETVTALRSFKTADQEKEPTIVGIEIAKEPNLTDYVEGERFNTDGMLVNAVYSDGSRKEITDYTVEPDRTLKVEDTAVIITWNGMTAQVMISVRSESGVTPTITGLEVTTAPKRTKYKVGEKFDTEGMVISAVYSDGRRQVVTDYTYKPNGKLTMDDTEITISWEGMTVKQAILVSSNDKNNNGSGMTNGNGTISGNNQNGSGATGSNGTSDKNNAINTGDSTQLFIWFTLMCLSIAAVAVIARRKKREKDIR